MEALEEILLSAKLDATAWDKNCIIEIFNALEEEAAQTLLFNLKKDPLERCFNGIFRLKDIVVYLKISLESLAQKRAKKAKIKGFSGTRLEEEEVLKRFFLHQFYAKLPQWIRE